MANLYTRGQARDAVRRRMGRLPATTFNIPGVQPGDPPPNFPWPDNASINEALMESLSVLNQETAFNRISFPTTIYFAGKDSATWNGEATRLLYDPVGDGNDGIGSLLPNAINKIHSVFWVEGGTGQTSGPISPNYGLPHVRLKPTTWDELARDRPNHRDATPGTPEWFVFDGFSLSVTPAPDEDGIVEFRAEITSQSPTIDTATVQQLSADFQDLWLDMAALRLAETLPGNVEMQGVAQNMRFRLYGGGSNIGGVQRFKELQSDKMEEYTPSFRPRFATRRTVRRR